jgi:succinate-semialdehyde dehydrogenase/glutarate-semialdehyde dehydrogenase
LLFNSENDSFLEIIMHGLKYTQLIKNFSYINRSWHTSKTDVAVTNPATGVLVASLRNTGVAETKLAIKSAKVAFKM